MKSGPTFAAATRTPRAANAAIRPVATVVLPTPEWVPATTMRGPSEVTPPSVAELARSREAAGPPAPTAALRRVRVGEDGGGENGDRARLGRHVAVLCPPRWADLAVRLWAGRRLDVFDHASLVTLLPHGLDRPSVG